MELTPKQASSLADDVYTLSRLDTIEEAIKVLNKIYNGKIAFSEDNMLKGKTGGLGYIKVRTAFGFCLVGQQEHKGRVFIVLRGTQYLADWLTNLNISLSTSSCGQPVHDGFNQTFQSMFPQIKAFSDSLPGGTQIHCIGHSLGGALATITAEWVAKSTSHTAYLYTFGSPRVGLDGFATQCTSLLRSNNGKARIYRAYHRTDIVPCIPIWPFVHTPNTDQEYYLPSPGVIPWSTWHDMKLYIQSVEKQSWEQLSKLRQPKRTDSGIEQWLKNTAIIGPTITAIEWLNDAIIYVIKKCFQVLGKIISYAASTYMTLMDRLAYILHQGVELQEFSSSLVVMLMRKIMEFLGLRKVLKAADMTREFIRGLLIKLSEKVNEISKEALSNTLADGRGL